ncbi:hypothetical protein AWB79_01263 [Caballeronia hypogeia]|uniref:Histone H1-like nucleoprotein HC2 n=1 Tax=Caballeronia hypogeia TaxID=1777140 RepID=A0A157ZRP0_9BURK|nr:hypothetical protein [Caballeronia hypogeia]SAK48204.1 hypothetical protein AWB79_01263 [Caballeronia hypogeia]
MSTPQVKAPTKKAFHFPKSANGETQAPAKTTPKTTPKNGAKKTEARTATTSATKTKAPATTPKNTKKTSPKAPGAKLAAKAPAVEATATDVKSTVKPDTKAAAKPDTKARRAKKESPKKEKVVRDSFTMPKSDYAKIASLKDKCQKSGLRVKKSELLRAALTMLDAAPEKRLVEAIKALETVKTGRPANA